MHPMLGLTLGRRGLLDLNLRVSLSVADLPEAIADMLGTAGGSRVGVGDSGADVFRMDGGLYLKVITRNPDDPVSGSLRQEQDRLEWLLGKLPVPEVRAFVQDETRDYLLITEVPGRNVSPTIGRAGLPWVIETLAEGCRQLHSIRVDGCPFHDL